MTDFLIILISTSLVNNVVLVQFLGASPFLGVSGKVDTALALVAATSVVLVISTAINTVLFHYLLQPLHLEAIHLLVFIFIIALVVTCVEISLRKNNDLLIRTSGLHITLITANAAVLGISLLNTIAVRGIAESIIYSLGTALGFSLFVVLFAAMRERLELSDVPTPFRGLPIALITAGLMSLGLFGFVGLV